MARKKKVKKEEIYTDEEKTLAKKIAVHYRMKVKAQNMFACPWSLLTPVESQPVFEQFLKTARLIQPESIDYKQFVVSQFDNWNGPKTTYPLPNQLHTQSALNRYSQWKYEHEVVLKVDSFKARKREGKSEVFANDELKLRRFIDVLGLPKKKILKRRYSEFSRPYLEHCGVWGVVGEHWLEERGGEG